MRKVILFTLLLLSSVLLGQAQTLRVLPTLSAESGSYKDQVTVTCTFPEGCSGGKWWTDGGELRATTYTAPVTLTKSCALSVAGTDATGRIITDVVTRQYAIDHVTPPSVVSDPAEGVRTKSFYVTRLQWQNVGNVVLDVSDYKEGGKNYGKNLVWLTDPSGKTICTGDANNLWADGTNCFKVYFYKDYNPTRFGRYTLHVAANIFVVDGKSYGETLTFDYDVTDGNTAPVFSPESGTYKGSVTVTIEYPNNGSAFYPFYRLNGGTANPYIAPITLTESATLEAYGMNEEFTATTPTTTASYTVLAHEEQPVTPLNAPKITRQANMISISGPEGTVLKYWLNHDMNTACIYTAPFAVQTNCHIACVAYTEGEEARVSPTTELEVNTFPVEEDPDRGNQVLLTPVTTETAHLRALSPNGRWAVGYIGSDTSSRGFVWDIESDEVHYASTLFINQLWYVNDEGVAYGWRTRTAEVDETMTEADILWGAYADGQWKEMPLEEYGQMPFPAAPNGYSEVTALSPNGEWAILGQDYRYNTVSGEVEPFLSMYGHAQGGGRPEVLTCINDEGLVFGTYDASLLSPEKGVALVRTADGRWRDVAEWLRDERGIVIDGYDLTSVRALSADGGTFLFHANKSGASMDETFTRGLVLRTDVPLHHLPPVSVKAEQMKGIETIRLTWKAPTTGAADIVSYTIRRNGETLATLPAEKNKDHSFIYIYYDKTSVAGESYLYTVSAAYSDRTDSQPSHSNRVDCQLASYTPVRNLSLRHVGFDGLQLFWDAPTAAIPRLQYFDEEDECMAFGTGNYDAEFGIRIPASDMVAYEGLQIRTFQFVPTGPQRGYTLNLYHGKSGAGEGIDYETTPFYSQSIDPVALQYGTLNTIELNEIQELDPNSDLYVALYIESAGNNNMLGISYDGFRSGYTDLCRIVGVHNKMVAMSQNSTETTEVVLPLGVGICTAEGYDGYIVNNYILTDNGTPVVTTIASNHRLEHVSTGVHDYVVTAVYRDGKTAEPVSLVVDMQPNEETLTALDVEVKVEGDAAQLSWTTPLDEDRTLIHWGDLTPSVGWEVAQSVDGFMAISAYPVTMTAPYAGDYEVSALYFCPTGEEGTGYELSLTDAEGNMLAYVEPADLQYGVINYVPLSQPVTVDPSVTYQVVVNVLEAPEGSVPLAYDSSGKWQNGYSNIINYGLGNTTLSELVQSGEQPNWLLGMVFTRKEAQPLPVARFEVVMDGQPVAALRGTASSYILKELTPGRHIVRVDATYGVAADLESGVMKRGNDVVFNIEGFRADAPYFLPGDGVYYVGKPSTLKSVIFEPTLVAQAYKAQFKVYNTLLASAHAGAKSYNLTDRITEDGTVLDLVSFMGIGAAEDLTVRDATGAAYRLGDHAPEKNWETTALIAAYPMWMGQPTLPLAVYDQWDCPVTYERDAQMADGVTVDFGNPHEGLVVSAVNFNVVTAPDCDLSRPVTVKLSVWNDDRTLVENVIEKNVQLSACPVVAQDGENSVRSAVISLGKNPLVIASPFEVSVEGLSEQAWLPRAIDHVGIYPSHTTYSNGRPATDNACVNVDGYFNYLGSWGWWDGKSERGEVIGSGDLVQVYYDPTDPDWPGDYFLGEAAFPLETTFGSSDIRVVENPDWITSISYDNSQWEEYGCVQISMSAEALPEGEIGRTGKVVLSTLDEASYYTIYIRQGAVGFDDEEIIEQLVPVSDVTGVGYDTEWVKDENGEFVKDENGQYIRIDKYDSLVDAQLDPANGDRVTVLYFWYDEPFVDINYQGGASVTNLSNGLKMNIGSVGFKSSGDSNRNNVIEIRLSTDSYIEFAAQHQGLYEVVLPAGIAITADARKNEGKRFRFTFGDPDKAWIPEQIDYSDYAGVYEVADKREGTDEPPYHLWVDADGTAYVYGLGDISFNLPVAIAPNGTTVLKKAKSDGVSISGTNGEDIPVIFQKEGDARYMVVDGYKIVASGNTSYGGMVTFIRTGASGIDSIRTESSRETDGYDLAGRRISRRSAQGVIISNNQKIIK